MPGPISVKSLVTTLASNALVDMKPPAGEEWVLHDILGFNDSTNARHAPPLSAMRGSDVLNMGSMVNTRQRTIVISTDLYVRFSGTSGFTYVAMASLVQAPLEGLSYALPPLTAGAVTDVKPPAGECWVMKAIWFPFAFQRADLRNASYSMDGIVYPNSASVDQEPRAWNVPLTELLWLRVSNNDSGTHNGTGFVTGFKGDTTVFDSFGDIQSLALGATVDYRPPVDETWMIRAIKNTAYKMQLVIGGTPQGGEFVTDNFAGTRRQLSYPIDHDTYVRFTAETSASTVGIVAMKLKG